MIQLWYYIKESMYKARCFLDILDHPRKEAASRNRQMPGEGTSFQHPQRPRHAVLCRGGQQGK